MNLQNFYVSVLLLTALMGGCSKTPSPPTQAQVLRLYSDYITAVNEQDREKVAALIDPQTMQVYHEQDFDLVGYIIQRDGAHPQWMFSETDSTRVIQIHPFDTARQESYDRIDFENLEYYSDIASLFETSVAFENQTGRHGEMGKITLHRLVSVKNNRLYFVTPLPPTMEQIISHANDSHK